MAGGVDYRHEQHRDYGLGSAPLRRRGRVVVVSGFATRLWVERGRLWVRSGSGRAISEESFGRAGHGLARLVVVGRAASMSTAAIGWCNDAGIGVVFLDRDGRQLAISGDLGVDHAALRRAQARAVETPVGVEISRLLLGRKLEGELDVLDRVDGLDAALTVTASLAALERAQTIDAMRQAEARAAAGYWSALANQPVRFAKRDQRHLPPEWSRLGQRTSPLTGSPRAAVVPGQAMLNYVLGVAEGEACHALRVCGLDVGIGIVHRDVKARASMAADVLEPIRPQVEGYLVELLDQRTLRASDFYASRRGAVRVLPSLTDALAQTGLLWAERLAPLAERVAEMLLEGRPTPLTQSRRSAGRDQQRRRERRRKPSPPRLSAACRTCGTPLSNAGRGHCNECLPEVRAEQRAGFAASGPAALARLRAEGADPAHGGDAGKRRSKTMRQRRREAAEWKRGGAERLDPSAFQREVLPLIRAVPLSRLAEATGLSLGYVSLIRRGERVPHPRHWPVLRQVTEAEFR
jgi:CRISPR-associated endonuclease Cas1